MGPLLQMDRNVARKNVIDNNKNSTRSSRNSLKKVTCQVSVFCKKKTLIGTVKVWKGVGADNGGANNL